MRRCLKHTIVGDFNQVSIAEVEKLCPVTEADEYSVREVNMLLEESMRYWTIIGRRGYQRDWAVRIDGDKIVETGPYRTLKQKYPDHRVIGDEKQLLMPGLLTLILTGQVFLCAAGRYL